MAHFFLDTIEQQVSFHPLHDIRIRQEAKPHYTKQSVEIHTWLISFYDSDI